ncbi:MAG: hypothetical protein ABI880_12925 [Acidobacteriota bacterium]
MLRASAHALLAGAVDYAGLFPPAALSMSAAAAEYRAALASPQSWMLGRFVTTAARLSELAAALSAPAGAVSTCRVSAIVRVGSADDIAALATFNAGTDTHHGVVDAVEAKPSAIDGIDWLAAHCAGLDVYVEIAAGPDAPAWLDRVAARQLRAKVRTGGVTPEAFPSPAALAGFLAAVVARQVPFKATAGLHHAVRGSYKLTYEPEAASAPMYGYLNLLLAAAAVRAGQPVTTAEALLRQSDAASLVFDDDAARWGAAAFPLSLLRDLRAHHLVSFGSCSFREPVTELDALASR